MIYNSSIEYPHISPLRWVEPLSEARYLRRAGQTDKWRVQFLSDNDLPDTFVLRAYSTNYGFYLCEFAFTKATLSTGKYYWDAYIDFTTVQAAIDALSIHYLDSCVTFKVHVSTYVYAEALPVLISDTSDTKQIHVWNSRNDFGTVFGEFDWETIFGFRVEACWENGYLRPAGEYETFMNQVNEPTVFNANPYNEYVLRIGDETGLDDGMIDQVYRFFACDAILVDFVQYVRKSIEILTNESRGTRYLDVTLVPATNRNTQNILGEVMYITNEESNIIDAVLVGGDESLIL